MFLNELTHEVFKSKDETHFYFQNINTMKCKKFKMYNIKQTFRTGEKTLAKVLPHPILVENIEQLFLNLKCVFSHSGKNQSKLKMKQLKM